MIRLEPMDEATYETWLEVTIRDYAQEKVEAGNWLPSDALERARLSFAELLPEGRATAGHELRLMLNEAGERVGYTWWVPEDRPFGRVAYIYDLAVHPEHRRKGYAQAALAQIEAYARERGFIGVQLSVFGWNAGARQLYLRAGFVETNVTMLKRVDS